MANSILYLCASSQFFLRHHAQWAKMAAQEREVHLAVNIDAPKDQDLLRERGFIVHPFHQMRGSINPVTVLREVGRFRSIIGAVSPDGIVAIALKCVFTAVLANATRSPRPLVGVVTGLGHMFTGESSRQRLLRTAVARTLGLILPHMRHRLVMSNQDDRAEFVRLGIAAEGNMDVIPVPGVDTGQFRVQPEPATGFKVVLPARMIREKGIEDFLEASRILGKSHPEIECILAGTPDPGNPTSCTREVLLRWDATGDIRWLGHVEDMPALFAGCHVVCLPSHREGCPQALIEGMAVGRPLVATDVPGCRDAVAFDNGLLVPVKNSGALAGALKELYLHPEKRLAMGESGRRAAIHHFSRTAISARFARLCSDFMDGE